MNRRADGDSDAGRAHDPAPPFVTQDPHTPSSSPASQALAIRALATVAFALNLNTNVLGALLPFVRADVPMDAGARSMVIGAAAAGSAVGGLATTALAARFGRRNAMVLGLGVFFAASLLHLVPGGLSWLITVRVLSGFAVGIAYAAASALVAQIVPYERRGSAMGRFTAGMFLAVPVGMPVAVLLGTHAHWSLLFAVQAVVAALGAVWALRAVPDRRVEESVGSLLRPLGSAGALAGLAATLLHVGSFFTTVQLATTWLDETGILARADQLWLWIGFGLLSVAGSAGFGRFSDAMGKRNFVLATSALLAGCFVLLSRDAGGAWLAGLGAVLATVAAARTGPLQALVSGLVPPSQLSALMGLRAAAMQLGVVGFAYAAAPVAERLGFRGVLMLAAGCQGASYLAIRLFVREGK